MQKPHQIRQNTAVGGRPAFPYLHMVGSRLSRESTPTPVDMPMIEFLLNVASLAEQTHPRDHPPRLVSGDATRTASNLKAVARFDRYISVLMFVV